MVYKALRKQQESITCTCFTQKSKTLEFDKNLYVTFCHAENLYVNQSHYTLLHILNLYSSAIDIGKNRVP